MRGVKQGTSSEFPSTEPAWVTALIERVTQTMHAAFLEENSKLKKETKLLRKRVSDLESRLASLEFFSRRCNVEIQNMPVQKDESPLKILANTAVMIGFKLRQEDVVKCYRMNKIKQTNNNRPPHIIAEFRDVNVCEEFMQKVRSYWRTKNYSIWSTDICPQAGKLKLSVVRQLPPQKKLLLGQAKKFAQSRSMKFAGSLRVGVSFFAKMKIQKLYQLTV